VKKFNKSTLTLLACAILIMTSCSVNSSGKELKLGAQYETIQPVYLKGVYNSLNDRTLSRETAHAYIKTVQQYNKAEVAFQVELPVGTIMTIASSAKSVLHIPFFVDQYVVTLTPDLSQGLDVILSLDRGLDGDLDGLNPEIFKKWLPGSDQVK